MAATPAFQLLEQALLTEHPRDEFMIFYENGAPRTIGTADYQRAIDQAAANLQARTASVAPGSWVGVCLPNSPWWYAVVFAVLKSGFNVMLVNPATPAETLDGYVRDASMAALIHEASATPDRTGAAPITVTLDELLAPTDAQPRSTWARRLAFCTSGSTGANKVVLYTDEAVAGQVQNIAAHFVPGTGNPRFLACLENESVEGLRDLVLLPMSHIYGFQFHLAFALDGYTLVFPKNPAVSGYIDTMREQGVFFTAFTPLLWKTIANICTSRYGALTAESLAQLVGPQFKVSSCGGAKLDNALRKAYLDAGVFSIVGHGMTEAGIICMDFPQEGSLETEGTLCTDAQIELRLLGSDGVLREEGEGELVVWRPHMMDAYLVNGHEEPWERWDGRWFRTGDIFRYENGFFTFVGRAKHVIVTETGENISAEELERHVAFLAGAADHYCVIELDGRPVLLVDGVAPEARETTTASLRTANAELPIYKKIARVVYAPQPLPLTAKGDVKRFALDLDAVRSWPSTVLVR